MSSAGGGGGLQSAIEMIRDRFYFVSLPRVPKSTTQAYFFSIDDELQYLPFLADFGPLHLGCVYRFCVRLEDLLHDPANAHRRVYLVSNPNQHLRANAACLAALSLVVVMGVSPDDAWRPLAAAYPPFTPFRDAAFGTCTFDMTILDCCRAMAKAVQHGFFDYDTFDVDEYDFYARAENGDMNWVIPKKFLHLSTPAASHSMRPDGVRNHTPEDYVPYFRKHSVNTVIRLNQKLYDRKRFTEAGVAHYDMFFTDGTTPPDPIIRRFMEVCERVKGSIAVHCKAGLGRTGSLVGLFMMKHYRMTAREVIAWLRIVRPGSVIGPQQHFLQDRQAEMWREWAALYGHQQQHQQQQQQNQQQQQQSPSTSTRHQQQQQQEKRSTREHTPSSQGTVTPTAARSGGGRSPGYGTPTPSRGQQSSSSTYGSGQRGATYQSPYAQRVQGHARSPVTSSTQSSSPTGTRTQDSTRRVTRSMHR